MTANSQLAAPPPPPTKKKNTQRGEMHFKLVADCDNVKTVFVFLFLMDKEYNTPPLHHHRTHVHDIRQNKGNQAVGKLEFLIQQTFSGTRKVKKEIYGKGTKNYQSRDSIEKEQIIIKVGTPK